jgi:hypothetical protein
MAPGVTPMRRRPRRHDTRSDMRNGVRDRLIDDVMDAYVIWRQDSAAVEFAYRRWSVVSSTDPASAFDAYAEALDREELASISYAQIIRRTVHLLARDRRRRSAAARRRLGAQRPTRDRRRRGPLPRGAGPRAGATRGRRPVRSGGRARSRRRASS